MSFDTDYGGLLTVTGDFSVFLYTYILILDDIYWLSVAHIWSLYNSYTKFERNTYSTFIKHIYRVCRTYIMLVQLAPHTTSRVTPRMTARTDVTKVVPYSGSIESDLPEKKHAKRTFRCVLLRAFSSKLGPSTNQDYTGARL